MITLTREIILSCDSNNVTCNTRNLTCVNFCIKKKNLTDI